MPIKIRQKAKNKMIPLHYGGIDRLYGDISIDTTDKILDLIDEYIEVKERIDDRKDDEDATCK